MAVSTYNNNNCRYRLDKLDNVVYLISEDASKNIHIDDGEAYVMDIDQEPLSLKVYNIALTDTDELDERYKFTHQLTFSVNGYANYRDFQGRYFAIVKSLDGVYWLVNPMFPCKVTYTYTLDGSGSHTDFTMSTASNHPTLRIVDFEKLTPRNCIGYSRCTFKSLKLNENKYSLKSGNNIKYTNDGFKDVVFDRNSASFTEQFDGNNISHSLQFNIKFDDYKSSWHYNLLEFMNNTYASIIENSCGKYILCGFGFGLRPSFNVTANDEATPDNIQIQLVDMHDNGDFIGYEDEPIVSKDENIGFIYTTENNGYECVGVNTARYLLKKEVDAFGNPTGRYMCLQGYETQFSHLNIVGTFVTTDEFVNPNCGGQECRLQTSFPSSFIFNTKTCRTYSLMADTDWSITSSSSHITVTPSNGVANTSYTIQVCNTLEPTSSIVNSTIRVNYCNTHKDFDVQVLLGNDCFTAGAIFDISANGQYVTVPTQCCVRNVTEPLTMITNIQIQNSFFKVYVPQNETGEARSFTLTVTFCDGTIGTVLINQGNGFERWVKESTACTGNQKCDVERKYTGTTASDINTWTNETRTVNCVSSADCGGSTTRWIDSTETTCSGGKKYIIQIEQVSTDGGSSWSNTGNKRLGSQVEDASGECKGVETEKEWREDTGYFCDGTTKYNRLRLWTRVVGGDWVATEVYKKGETVIATDSFDCGYVVPSTAWTCSKWEVIDDEEQYICEDGNKYKKERRYVRNCNDCNSCEEEWIPTDVYRRSEEQWENDSLDCGYDPSVTGNCTDYQWLGDFICDGFSKYKYLQKFVRDCADCNNCSAEWIATNIKKRGDLMEEYSIDCGYIPTENYFEWREDGTICNGYDKYTRYRKYISEDGNNWYRTNIFKLGDSPIEVNSVDCGYDEPIEYEYRWTITDKTVCIGFDKYKLYKKQRRVKNLGSSWEDVVPTVYSYNGEGEAEPVLVEKNSEDCGYTPQPEPEYKWEDMNIQTDWICSDCDDVADFKLRYWYKNNNSGETFCDSTSAVTRNDYNGDTSIHRVMISTCVTGITDGAFSACTNLVQVMIPDTVTSIGAQAFLGDDGIIDFTLPSSITTIGDEAFRDCLQINSMILSNELISLGAGAFRGCANFASINIPSKIATIPSYCFYGCKGMTDLIFPDTLVSIGAYAFAECNGLTYITVTSQTPPELASTAFNNVNSEFKIFVPNELVDTYKAAAVWSTFADKIVGI